MRWVSLFSLSPFLSGLNFIHWTYLLFRLVESRRGRQTAYLALPLLIKVYSWGRCSEVDFLSFSWRIVCWTYKVLTFPSSGDLPGLVSTSHGPCQPHAVGHKVIMWSQLYIWLYLIRIILSDYLLPSIDLFPHPQGPRGERIPWRLLLPTTTGKGRARSRSLPVQGNSWLLIRLAYEHCTRMKYILPDIYDWAYYI